MNLLAPAQLSPLWFLLCTLAVVFVAYGARVALFGRATDPRIQRERPTALLGTFPMEAVHWALRCAGSWVTSAGVSPDTVTWASLILTAGTAPLAATGHFDWAALLLALGSACDAIDGIVARKMDISSDSGEVFDAVVDRYADAMPLAGLAIYYRQDVFALCVILVAIVGSSLVSYVRAKAESMQLTLQGGLMRRHERLVYLGLGLAVGPYIRIPFMSSARPVTVAVVAFVGIIANIAAGQLTRQARRMLNESGRGPPARH